MKTKEQGLLDLYVPKRADLWFRRELLSDPETMSYNRGCGLELPEYHNDTGCIDFPEGNWDGWAARWLRREPERYYAYLRRKSDGAFLGEVNLYRAETPGWYNIGIVLHSRYRGLGYSREGLDLLLETAFEDLGAAGVQNNFEKTRKAAWQLHLAAGFVPVKEENGAMLLEIGRENYLRRVEK